MFSSKLKRSTATVGAIACVLGAAGPASATSAQRLVESQNVPTSMEVVGMAPNGGLAHARGFKSLGGMDWETEFMAYVHAGGGWDPLGYQHQNDLESSQAPNTEGFWRGSNDALG